MKRVDIRQLPFGGKAALCWSLMWRGLLIGIGSMLAGGLVGGLVGFLMGLVFAMAGGRPPSPVTTQLAGGGIGLLIGIYFLYLYLKWILSVKLGRFRLALFENEAEAAAPAN